MSTETHFRNTQISAFNPGRLTDEEIEKIFITRVKVFEHLFAQIISEKANSIPQHILIVGERGMGKSTLLHRLAVELRKTPHNTIFIPLTFPEEQYNVDRLTKFWLNCLDALADALDRTAHPDLALLDSDIDRWNKDARQITAKEMYMHFVSWSEKIRLRPVLLVDNINLIFDKISKEEQHQLRAVLMENDAPVLVGASAHTPEDVVDYGAPFYDYFKQQNLKKLSFEESMDTLRNLGELTQNQSFINEIYTKRGRMRALYQLTGGTPRTLTMLFPLIQNGLSVNIQTDLEALMDTATALYKSRFEELPAQMQVVLDAVAMHWDPVNLETLRELTQLDNAQISPQIKRLYDVGWITRMDAYKAKGNAYEISERFFNIWYLMRRSSRRQKRELLCLTKFLATLYGEELPEMAHGMLEGSINHPDNAGILLAMADAIGDKKLAKKLRDKSHKALVEFGLSDPAVFRNFEIPDKVINKKADELSNNAFRALKIGQIKAAVDHLENYVKLIPDQPIIWAILAIYYYDNLKMYEKAEKACLKSLEIDPAYFTPKHILIVLYRDIMGQLVKAKTLFEELKSDYNLAKSLFLHAALFSFYEKNVGIGLSQLQQALDQTKGEISTDIQNDWWRFAAVTHRLGYGKEVLDTLEKTGYDVQLRPYYVAIKALGEADQEGYLNSIAAEIREPARFILEKIKGYL